MNTNITQAQRLLNAQKSGLNRREMLTRAAAAGLLPLGAQFIATEAMAATPKKGGLIRIGLDGGSTTDTMDPRLWAGSAFPSMTYNSVFDQLVQVGSDGGPEGMLAKSWEPNGKLDEWTLVLESGVTFHDGRQFTARDVAYSVAYLADELNVNAAVKRIAQSITEASVIDDTTIKLTLDKPNLDFPLLLATRGFLIVAEDTTDFSTPNGTGPYRLESYEPAVRARLVKYENFWTDKQGHFSEVDIINIKDAATRTSAVRNGNVDVVNRPDVDTVSRLAGIDGIELFVAEGGQHYTTPLNAAFEPFGNPDVRMAIKYGVRRQEFVDKVLGGLGYPGNDHPIGKNYQFLNTELDQLEYDPDRARFHWEKAGLSGSPLLLKASDGAFSGSVRSAQLIQASLAEAGIEIEVESVPGDGYWKDVWRNVPWCYSFWNGSATTGQQLSYFMSDNAYNDCSFQNERYDTLVASAQSEKDTAVRAEMYAEAQQLLHENGGLVVLGFSSFVNAGSSKLGHGVISANQPADDNAIARRWWWNE